MFHTLAINIYTRDLLRLVTFYKRLGFRETFRTPKESMPVHVEVTLDQFTLGIASVESALIVVCSVQQLFNVINEPVEGAVGIHVKHCVISQVSCE